MVSVLRYIKHPLKRLVEIRLIVAEETLWKLRDYCMRTENFWSDECVEELILKQLEREAETALGVVP